MSSFDYDFFVIGAGSGGVRAARTAAALGAKVGIAEEKHYGGTCVNVGCVPKKLFVYASQFPHQAQLAAGFGLQFAKPEFDWASLRDRKTQEVERLNGIYQNLLRNSGVDCFNARAQLLSNQEVELSTGQRIRAKHILIAVGGKPWLPDDLLGREHLTNSDQMFYLPQFPKRALVVGGGYIAVEFAGILNGLGCETTLIHRGDYLLRGFDLDVRQRLQQSMQARGIRVNTQTQLQSIVKSDSGLVASFNNSELADQEFDLVLCATGRMPYTQDLGLEQAGVELDDRGAIKVDERYQTTATNVYAVGDVLERVTLTPVALAEGMLVARQLFAGQEQKLSYDFIPSAVFSQPELAVCGLTEEQALEQYPELDIYQSEFKPMLHSLGGSDERCYMKLVVDAVSQRVVGAMVLGEHAAEMMQGFAVAMNMGATKADFDATIGIHPSAAEEMVTMRTKRQ